MKHSGLILTSPPSIEPLTLAEAKAFLRVDTTDDDSLITSLIVAARQFCENYTKRAFITRTYDLWLDQAPNSNSEWWDGVRDGALSCLYSMPSKISLPMPPFKSLTSITTYDLSDASSSFDITNLISDTASVPGRIILKYGQIWPSNLRYAQCMDIRYTAGYGDAASDVPNALIQAIKIMTAHMYENRTPFDLGRAAEVPLSIESLLTPYRVLSI
jgi:hypothetical protein